jgi:hypothetical protein
MVLQVHQQVVEDWIDHLAVAVNQSIFPLRVEAVLVQQHLQELTDLENDLLLLSLLAVDDTIRVQVLEDVGKEVSQLEGVQLIQSNECEVLVERFGIEETNDLLDLLAADGVLLWDELQFSLSGHRLYFLNFGGVLKMKQISI